MRLEQLKYYIVTADRGSISLAAKELNLAQQTLSSSIKNLEEDVGTILFSRSKQGVIRTPAGEKFYNFAVKTVSEYEQFQNSLRNSISPKTVGRIRILSLNAYKTTILPALKVYFMKNYPNVHLDIRIADYQDIFDLLMQNHADIAILHLAHNDFYEVNLLPDHIHFYSLFNAELYFWVSNFSSLSTGQTINFKQIKKQKLILSSETDKFLLDDLIFNGKDTFGDAMIFHEYSTICQMIENDLAICPDIKLGKYGLFLEKMFHSNSVTSLLYKSPSTKKLTAGYLTTDIFEKSAIYLAIQQFFNSLLS